MSARREHGGGEAALENEAEEASQEEQRVAEARRAGWESRKEQTDDQA